MHTPVTTSERVYKELRQMVFTGELAPGERLVQRKLAGRLGVSSIPIVEATRRLERDGLVVSHANWGAQVQIWTDEDVEAAYLAREALEGICCRLFVQRADDIQRAELVALARRFDEQVIKKDSHGWLESDMALHNHIVRSTRAQTLIHIADSSFLITMTMRNAHKRSLGSDTIFPDPGVHDDIVAALLGTDPDAAEQAGRAHIRRAYEKLRAIDAAMANTPILSAQGVLSSPFEP
ncbi:MAG TPA: GntR family transcriptional regulator [Capsulimonadaceae bacterium]